MVATLHIVCPSCMTANKLSAEKLHSKPKCGKCGNFLFTGKPVELGDENFIKFTSKTEIPVVVDFWAAWCGPCKMMAPVFEQAAQQMEPKIRFTKVDTEQARATSAQFGIRSIPTIALLKAGKVVAQQAGAVGLPQLLNWINQHAGANG